MIAAIRCPRRADRGPYIEQRRLLSSYLFAFIFKMKTVYQGLNAQVVVTDLDFPAWLEQAGATLQAIDMDEDLEDDLQDTGDVPEGVYS